MVSKHITCTVVSVFPATISPPILLGIFCHDIPDVASSVAVTMMYDTVAPDVGMVLNSLIFSLEGQAAQQ
jgi:hypothetical protein